MEQPTSGLLAPLFRTMVAMAGRKENGKMQRGLQWLPLKSDTGD